MKLIMEKYDKEERLKYLLENKDKIFSLYPEGEIARYIAEEEFNNSEEKFYQEESIAQYTDQKPNIEDYQDFRNSKISKSENDLLNLDIKDLCKKFIDIEEFYYSRYRHIILKSELREDSFKFWNRKSVWSFKEFILLENNINPKYRFEPFIMCEYDLFKKIYDAESKIKTLLTRNIIKDYNEITELLEDSILCGEISKIRGEERQEDFEPKHLYNHDKFRRNDLINWCKQNDISLPKEFLKKKPISELEEENKNLKNQKSKGGRPSINRHKIWGALINHLGGNFSSYEEQAKQAYHKLTEDNVIKKRNKTALVEEVAEKAGIGKTTIEDEIESFLKEIFQKP